MKVFGGLATIDFLFWKNLFFTVNFYILSNITTYLVKYCINLRLQLFNNYLIIDINFELCSLISLIIFHFRMILDKSILNGPLNLKTFKIEDISLLNEKKMLTVICKLLHEIFYFNIWINLLIYIQNYKLLVEIGCFEDDLYIIAIAICLSTGNNHLNHPNFPSVISLKKPSYAFIYFLYLYKNLSVKRNLQELARKL